MSTPSPLSSETNSPTGGDAAGAVELVWTRLESSLRCVARSMTKSEDLQDDLIQEALIKLWELDPTRFDTCKASEFRYLRRVLINRMWDVIRVERAGPPMIELQLRLA